MKHYFLIIVIILFIRCNSKQQNTKQKEVATQSDKCFTYPSIVDSLHIKNYYDSTRWYLYILYCDKFYEPKNDSSLKEPYAELELKFNDLIFRHDTLAVTFNFMYKNEPILPSMMREYRPLITGVGFDTATKKKIYMISSNTTITSKGNPKNRYENPMQPEVIKYIKDNWDKLNDCFRELAQQKGIRN